MFVTAIHFCLSPIFAGKAAAYQSGALKGLNSNGWLAGLSPIIRLGRKSLALANTVAYYDTTKITAAISFIVPAPVACIINLI